MGATTTQEPTAIAIPAGTLVRMYISADMTDNASEHQAKAGDHFDAIAASDVVVNGVIVVRKNSVGGGTIVNVRNRDKEG